MLSMTVFAQRSIKVDNIIYEIRPDRNDLAKVTRKNGGYSGDITIPETIKYEDKTYRVTSIDDYTFHYNSELTSVILPNSITTIGHSAFSYCENLASISTSTNITSIGQRAFFGCKKLKEISLPNSVTEIGDMAFEGCSSLTNFTIPSSMTCINYRTFYECSNLTSITIPQNIKYVYDDAFRDCTNLSYVLIRKLSDLGESVFYGCCNLTKVICLTKVPLQTNFGAFSPSENTILYVPEEAINEYKATYPWKVFKTIKAIDKYTIERVTTQISITSTKNYDIKVYDGAITVYSSIEGQEISVFTIDGKKINTTVINNGSATVSTNLKQGAIVIVKIGQVFEKIFIR